MNDLIYFDYKDKKNRNKFGNEQLPNGVQQCILSQGPSKSVSCININTASGVRSSVLPDRGLDISMLGYRGISLSWMSPAGIWHPSFFDGNKKSFEKTFFGGYLTTCGLTQAGTDCEYNDEYLSLHGRISNIPSTDVSVYGQYDDTCDEISIEGYIREYTLYEENLLMHRKVSFKKNEALITVSDIIENTGYKSAPNMVLYHYNFGFPLVGPDLQIKSNFENVKPLNDFARDNELPYNKIIEPDTDYLPDNYIFENCRDTETCRVKLFNPGYQLGVELSYPEKQLSFTTMWKMLAPTEYVIGIEPGNCLPEGRKAAEENGRLVMLEPGEKKKTEVTVRILEDDNECC